MCTAGEGQAPTRQATLGAGIRPSMIFRVDWSQFCISLNTLVTKTIKSQSSVKKARWGYLAHSGFPTVSWIKMTSTLKRIKIASRNSDWLIKVEPIFFELVAVGLYSGFEEIPFFGFLPGYWIFRHSCSSMFLAVWCVSYLAGNCRSGFHLCEYSLLVTIQPA